MLGKADVVFINESMSGPHMHVLEELIAAIAELRPCRHTDRRPYQGDVYIGMDECADCGALVSRGPPLKKESDDDD